MLTSTIITRARLKLDEASAKFWTDAELLNYINKGYYYYWQWMIQAQHPLTLKPTTLDTTAGTATVALPSDFIAVRLLEYVYSDRTEPLVYRERYDEASYTNLSSADNTSVYTYRIEGSNLVLEPTPQTTTTSGILKMIYYYLPDELGTGDTPTIPAMYHNLLIDYCVVQGKRKEEAEGGGGTDIGVFMRDLMESEQSFKEMIERSSYQRIYVQHFGSY